VAGTDDPFRGLLRLVEIQRIFLESPQAHIRIGHDRHQGLVHLVGDRCRELAHRRQSRDAREIRLRVSQRLLLPNLLGVLRAQRLVAFLEFLNRSGRRAPA